MRKPTDIFHEFFSSVLHGLFSSFSDKVLSLIMKPSVYAFIVKILSVKELAQIFNVFELWEMYFQRLFVLPSLEDEFLHNEKLVLAAFRLKKVALFHRLRRQNLPFSGGTMACRTLVKKMCVAKLAALFFSTQLESLILIPCSPFCIICKAHNFKLNCAIEEHGLYECVQLRDSLCSLKCRKLSV